jgi:hypothetical protein
VTIFDLLFLVLLLVGVGTLIAAVVAAVRGRRGAAVALLRWFGLSAIAYLGIVAVVSLTSTQRFLHVGDDRCSDDWCIAVAVVQRTPVPAGASYRVTFRVSSRARRVVQRERGVRVYLRDDRGRRFDPDPAGNAVPFDVRLEPLQQVTTTRAFTVPADAPAVGLVVWRTSGTPFPGCCIIGGEGSLFHRRTMVRLG